MTDYELCPVEMFELYTSKLHKDFDHLWQRPKCGVLSLNDPVWYDCVVVGEDSIDNFMKKQDAKLDISTQNTPSEKHVSRPWMVMTLKLTILWLYHLTNWNMLQKCPKVRKGKCMIPCALQPC